MKAFIERTLPIAEPFIEKRGIKSTHPLRQSFPYTVVLSVAGFIEMAVFNELSHYVNFLYGRSQRLLAEIYQPDSLDSFMLFFSLGLNAEAVGEGKAYLQFNFSGEVNNSCYFIIENSRVDAKEAVRKIRTSQLTPLLNSGWIL